MDVVTHVDRFNAAVLSGDWATFVDALHPDAVMTFTGVPFGPYEGREAIAAAYTSNPPTDTMRIVANHGNGRIDFVWSRGGTGTLALDYADDQVIGMQITFP
ncbi:nuclear transport factor 2 family protein [Actinoplanes bogorensis]|uniref:Nuclear transport factor 2 family protein n=1 Tax=Paractinoplanes bogorensis TaxID=1610840 RepID=A0ABS5YM19_9ACTN|nr:nuclear transport factor 2 family protein [Actinoplanes bogorensis]MBU2664509.1 nuclear transport factor 2 family protein [Actinoplanes bogorensis]